jgi:hypothetical protein
MTTDLADRGAGHAGAGSVPLPLELDGIDAAWLTAALRTRAPDVTVRGFEVVTSRRGTCTKLRLRLDLDDAGRRAGIPETVILQGGFEPHSRKKYLMHEREVRGYRDVYPVLKTLPTPDSYFTGLDPERRQAIVIMEDMDRRGVTWCDPLQPQGFDEVARRLTVLAGHHAATWNSPDFAPGRRWDWVDEASVMSKQGYRPCIEELDSWRNFVTSPRGAAASVRFHDRDWLLETQDKLIAYSRRMPHAVLHGDTHLGNLYVERDGTPGFLDSVIGRGPPLEEVTYHLTGALDLADRRRWEGALIQHYLEALRGHGVEAPGFDEAMAQYATFLARGFIIFMFNDSIFQPEAVNTAFVARFSAAMIDHDTQGRLAEIDV